MSTTTTDPTTTEQKKPNPCDFYPCLLYNHKSRSYKVVADEKAKQDAEKDEFVEEPFPPEDPDALSPQEQEQLTNLLAKAAKAIAKLGKLSDRDSSSGSTVQKPIVRDDPQYPHSGSSSKPPHQAGEPVQEPSKGSLSSTKK